MVHKEENIIQIMVDKKTKELAICKGEYPKQTCKKVILGRELSQEEIDKSIMMIELDLDRL